MTTNKKKDTITCTKSGFTYKPGITHPPVDNPSQLPMNPKPFDQCVVNGYCYRATISGNWKLLWENAQTDKEDVKFKYLLFKRPLGHLQAELTETQAKVFLDHQNVTESEIDLFSWMYPHDAHLLESLRNFVPKG